MPAQETQIDNTGPGSGLLVAARRITAARTRTEQPSDGGGTGRSDGND